MSLTAQQFLKPFRESDFFILENWVKNADDLFQFSANDFTFPLNYSQFSDYSQKHPERNFYLGYTPEGRVFAFGEIIPQSNNIPRLGRLLIGDVNDRGKGLGKYFIRLLIKECQLKYHSTQVGLYVIKENSKAIYCYESLGFKFTDDEPIILKNGNRDYLILKMELNIAELK